MKAPTICKVMEAGVVFVRPVSLVDVSVWVEDDQGDLLARWMLMIDPDWPLGFDVVELELLCFGI